MNRYKEPPLDPPEDTVDYSADMSDDFYDRVDAAWEDSKYEKDSTE